MSHIITFENCHFTSNTVFILKCYNATNLTLIGNIFRNNSQKFNKYAILGCDNKTELTFKGYNEFVNNAANFILRLQSCIFIAENSILNISHNKPLQKIKSTAALIYYKHQYNIYSCLFQFLSPQGVLDKNFLKSNKTDYRLFFDGNKGYHNIVYGSKLNSCYWNNKSAFHLLTPGDVYRRVLHFDTNIENAVSRQYATFCYCKSETDADCITDHFGPIYPGQTISLRLTQVLPVRKNNSESFTAIHKKFLFFKGEIPYEECLLVKSQDSKWVQQINEKCSSLAYKVYSASNDSGSCVASLNDIGADNSRYLYYFDFKPCPLGFDMYNGSCQCNRHLKNVFPRLLCDIETQIIIRPGKTWIGLSSNKNEILYVKTCMTIFCEKNPSPIQIEYHTAQCKSNRVGVSCGECPPGLSTTFGFYECKRCSNYWLFLLLLFMLAGVFLILSLFALNLTVVDGKIYGFILYANMVAGNSFNMFPSKKNIFFILLSLFNLDLGIEICFYNGMTEYDKTWLQFAFPSYLLFIVAMLALASRYSSSVEKLTRKRVIPVIATIILLAYSKLLLVIAKVLFSYTKVYSLPDHHSAIIWKWDSSVPLFGIKFSILFIVCLLIFLCIFIPFNLLMLFTKFSYRFRLVAEYLKPYLDAYQASFKDKCSYFFGIELMLRPICYAIGNRILNLHATLAVNTLIFVLFLIYICAIKPFKSTINTVLYTSYFINIGCLVLLVTYFDYNIRATAYAVLYDLFLFVALAEFAIIIVYYSYISYLCKVKVIARVVEIMTGLLLNCKKINSIRGCTNKDIAIKLEPLGNYEQYQEELLAIDT